MKRLIRGLVTGVSIVVLALGSAGAAVAHPDVENPADHKVSSDGLSPGVLAAMQRDLGLSPAAARLRLAQQARAIKADGVLQERLGSAFGGSWFDANLGKLVVGVTDATLSSQVRAAGAEARVVRHSEATLRGITAKLDRLAGKPAGDDRAVPAGERQAAVAGLVAWHVDPTSNRVVVTALRGAPRAPVLDDLDQATVRIEYVDSAPRAADNIIDGGDAIFMGGGRCSAGFNLRNGSGQGFVLIAGHCGTAGTGANGHDGNYIGPFVQSWFPTYDDAIIRNDNPGYWVQGPWVDTAPSHGGRIGIGGYSDAPVGTSMCKSGSTTGLTCGTITGKDETVSYGGTQTVYGLTRHSACVEQGDSGGSNFTGSSAEGVSSGAQLYWDGSRYRCGQAVGQATVSWYFPIADSLAYYGPAFGLSLW
ncbi:MAG TPA: S1 family peptidase [Micromonosporaceae bacterium]|jgi:streptogrisin C|nr:S1 family peptidase [Micromonosporaceae bacterium]